jgi:hypothetical protein
VRFRDAFEEAGILKKFTEIVDNINSTLIIVERYKSLPPILAGQQVIQTRCRKLESFNSGS